MPNMCGFDLMVAGKESAVKEFVHMLSRTGPYGPDSQIGLGRVFSFGVHEGFTERNATNSSFISIQGCGDCGDSFKISVVDASPFNLESECERLGIVVEAFSSEPGAGFQEHFLCNKGVLEIAECVDYHESVPSNMNPEDIESLAQERGLTVDELWSKVNVNGEYKEGGFDNYAEFQDLFEYFDFEKEGKFIPDDEILFCHDPNLESANFYLWATDSLVKDLHTQESQKLSPENLEAMENINFYANYNLHTKQVSISGTYYIDEAQFGFDLPIADEDIPYLLSSLENYCRYREKSSCMEVIDEVRKEEGKGSLAQICALEDKLQDSDTIEYKGILFDNWTIDQETAGIYGEMCEDCAEKYKDILSDELDDGSAIGACSVKGCSVIGAENGDAKHYYIDFNPELIKVPERKPSLDAICADAESRRTSSQSSPDKTIQKEAEH